MSEQPQPPEQVVLPEDKPIPFKKEQLEKFAKQAPDVVSPPTSRRNCEAAGGHGGANGKRVYYASGKLGPILGDPLICEICGEVDV